MAIMASGGELLPLNDTKIVFLHPKETAHGKPCAAQISVKMDESQKTDTEPLITYALAQRDITQSILQLVTVHLRTPLPESFEIEGKDFTLLASRKRWVFGKRSFRVAWGDDRVEPCEDKWTFVFRMKK